VSSGPAAYQIADWHTFLTTAAGAAAALAGLIFVSVSINLRDILSEEKKIGSAYLTGRALESLAALLVILAISIVGLDPSINRVVFSVVLLGAAVGSAISPYLASRAYRASRIKPIAYNLRFVMALSLVAGYAIAGVSLLARSGGGLHWLPFAFVLAVLIAASNAWILLVEVLR
jgi:hypothetical protein